MPWSRGIVGSMPAATDTDRIFRDFIWNCLVIQHEGINGESTWNGPVVKPRAGLANARQRAGQPRRNPALPLDRQTLVVARPVGRPRRNPAPVAEGLSEPRPVDRPHRNPASVAEGLAALPRPVGHPRRNSAPVAEDHVTLPQPIGRPRQNPAPVAEGVAVLAQPIGQPRQNPPPEAVVDAAQPLDRRVVAAEAVAIPGEDMNDEGDPAPANVRCSVCLFNVMNRIFLPFAHTYCHECIDRFERNYHVRNAVLLSKLQ
ncbi:putative microtubule-associated protein futsch isoform X1 [Daphnia sinensis]|uniref:Microtubule-associated protein futsch isoform X1 n=1 Tax=Daphnia sinensis TaxID=1820382 RepID=A0AAD5KH58_9CRUS|nr:putative microtubule-associated protein futsch isoform X1 [Daphnia sinensis]KAI9551136.1 putative microtubule-associated protein futsch isoform X1 [Daphnia sinensis]KAI9551183.1 putative microtubule-associated protein futsch isoform X1 [Daphnia sinensis]